MDVGEPIVSEIRVISFGLGPIGSEVARVAASKSNMRLVGAVDIDPSKVGRTVEEVTGAPSEVIVSSSLEEALQNTEADLILHTTSSFLEVVKSQIESAIEKGLSVVSTCEELSYPWRTYPGLATELDMKAKEANVRILGTGVNPGFVMDAFPLTVTTVCQKVDRIHIERVVDAGGRRLQLQRKVGAGLTVEEFRQLVATGNVRHVGLPESAWMIIDAMGWECKDFEESIEPIVAEREILAAIGNIQPGQVAGVRQTIRAYGRDIEKLVLDLKMYVGADEPVDHIQIWGIPDLDLRFDGGVHGDRATASIVVNAASVLMNLPPGLRTMLDVMPLRFRS